MPLEIRPDHLKIVEEILEKHLPDREVWAFGSRVNGTAKETSDLDLVVIGETPLDFQTLGSLRDDFSESNLPYKVDVVDWAKIGETFREIIRKDKVIMKESDFFSKGWLYYPDFPNHWIRAPLYSLAKWVNGLAFRESQLSPIGMPVIKISEIKNGISEQTKFTNQSFDLSFQVKKGDLLFSWSGQPETSIDAFWWRRSNGWLNQHIFRVLPIEEIDRTFFFYLLRYLKPNFIGIARNKQTTGLGHVTKRDLEKIEVAYPSLPEQRAIAHILGTLDDKIELNRRMNETLEAMAQALFKSWFVDFDPVRAKMEGRPTGLPKEIEDLFPDSFEDSELGEIPRGWEVKSVEDCISRLPVGRKYEQKTVSPIGRIPVLDQGKSGIIGYHDHAPSLNASIDKPIAVFANHTCYMRLVYFPFSVIQNVLPFVGNDLETIWVFYATYNIQSFIEYKGHWPDFVIKKIVVPNIFLTREFSRMVHPLLKTTWANECESNTLIAIRDTLLPKILSGEIRVKNVENLIRSTGERKDIFQELKVKE